MTKPKDPFDFTDTSDLPEDMRKSLAGTKGENSVEGRSLDLIRRAGRAVNAAAVRAAYLRIYGDTLNQTQVRNAINHLYHQGRLKREGVGLYSAVEDK